MSQWYQLRELEGDTVIGTSSTGYSNDELGLSWIKHFDKHTVKGTQGSKRLLIIDGHGSHHTKQFIQYCDDHGIIPFGLSPHLTHLLQPLDVVVFQPYKHCGRDGSSLPSLEAVASEVLDRCVGIEGGKTKQDSIVLFLSGQHLCQNRNRRSLIT
jgi:hypothetical protein